MQQIARALFASTTTRRERTMQAHPEKHAGGHARPPRVFVLSVGVLALVAALVGPAAYATHWAGSVTDVLNSSYETTPCHGSPYYFNPIYGWARTCNGAHDIANGYVSANIYIRGYVWNSAYIVNAQGNTVYADQFCGTPVGTEYNNAWQIDVPTGIAGIGYHHMSNYHYAINSTVPNGTLVGEQANWGRYVYYCSGSLASTGPHVHTEAAREGIPDDSYLIDTWMFGSSPPNFPFIRFEHP